MGAQDSIDRASAKIAAAIGEPVRARILFCLMDDRARTATELAAMAEVGTSTASAHLERLLKVGLLRVTAQGRHRYHTLAGPDVARVLEGLSVVAGAKGHRFIPSTPDPLRCARTCYDHIAGSLGVALHERLRAMKWLTPADDGGNYSLTALGASNLRRIGVDPEALEGGRRRLAYGCLDWSERRMHIGGSLGAALLRLAVRNRWLDRDLEGRCLTPTPLGRRELSRHFGITV